MARRAEPAHSAAGPRAVATALRTAVGRMGLGRAARGLSRLNQADGFDCPGCAWPEPGHRHHAEFCENGAKHLADEATRARADGAFFARRTVAELAAQSDHWIGRQGRIAEPMHLAPGAEHYKPVAWDDAYALIARHLNTLNSPDEAIFYTSGRTSNEAAFAYQAFARALGTNNLPDCSNMCHESSGVALSQTIGIGKGSVSLDDIEQADLLVVVGQNPGSNHPRMLTALEQAKRAGARIVSVNPLPEAGLIRFRNPQRLAGMLGRGTALADLHLPVRVNGDLALFSAVNRLLLDADAIDREFIERHTEGLDELRAHLQALSWEDVLEATGLERAQIEEFARLATDSERTIVCWAMGLTQHRNAVATIREVVNFLLLRGNIGRPGAGVCPVRGHSNVQGDRTMGITERPDPEFREGFERALGFPPPAAEGVDVVGAIRAMRDRRARVFMALGGNFLSAAPDTGATAAALANCALTVHVATTLNRSHVTPGGEALLLPTLGRSERDVRAGALQTVSVEDSMSVVHGSAGVLEPATPDVRSEVAIVCELAHATLDGRTQIPWLELADDYAAIRRLIERAIPGFEDFEARLASGGFVLPHPPRDELRFQTPGGRAHLTVNPLEILRPPAGHVLLQTLRSHDQFNTTIYTLTDRYRGIKGGRRVVMVNAEDLPELGVAEGEVVDLVADGPDGVQRRARSFRVLPYPTARGCAAAYYPETNVLVALDSVADESGTPVSKSVVVRFERPVNGPGAPAVDPQPATRAAPV